MTKKQKVLMIIMDQFRADLLSGDLAAYVDLPNIRAFQQDAVTFNRHYSVTNPCGPSRASIFTGRYAMNHRSIRNGTPMADHIPNLAQEARKAGYEPCLYGYTDTSLDPRSRHPNDPALTTEEQVLPGFTERLEMRLMESYPWRAYLHAQGYDIPEYAHFYDSISPDPTRPAHPSDPPFYRAEHSDTAFLANTLIHDLAVRIDQNWFALATFLRPHPPFVAPEPYNRLVDPATLPLPHRLNNVADQVALHPFMQAAVKAPPMEKTVRGCDGQVDGAKDADVQLLRALYLGLAIEVDAHIGRIFDFLKETGQYDDTLIILMADHGEALGDHHLWGKQNPYEPSYHIPLIIRDPRHPAQHGAAVDAFSESVDITPTVLDLMGLAAPKGMDGQSLRPFLIGETPDRWRDHVFMELDFAEPDQRTIWQKATQTGLYDSNLSILRDDRFKLVHFNGNLPPLLFDMQTDPHELRDLASDPAHAGTLLHLTQKLLSHHMRYHDHSLTHIRLTPSGAAGYTA